MYVYDVFVSYFVYLHSYIQSYTQQLVWANSWLVLLKTERNERVCVCVCVYIYICLYHSSSLLCLMSILYLFILFDVCSIGVRLHQLQNHRATPWMTRLVSKRASAKETDDKELYYCRWKESCTTWDEKQPCKWWDKLPTSWVYQISEPSTVGQ